MSEVIYIDMSKSVEITKNDVTVADIAEVSCKNKNIVNKVNSFKVLKGDTSKKKRYIISIMKIIEMINNEISDAEINNIGEVDCIVELKQAKNTRDYLGDGTTFFEVIKVILVCAILFFGAAFSIMAFNNDIGVTELFDDICEHVGGNENIGGNIIRLFYAIGLFIGISVFYNHFGSKKLSIDPTPIEVEMRNYEDDICNTLIEGHNRKDGKIDIN